MTDPATLPEGQDSFKLNEVCKLAGVQPYMLRFWGTEFPQVEAKRTGTGQRVYSREQVELILEVKRLLFDEGLTVAGAKRRLQAEEKRAEAKKPARRARASEPKGLQLVDEAPTMPAVQASPESIVDAVEPAVEVDEAPVLPTVRTDPGPVVGTVDLAGEVDKATRERVKPLLATLREVREELVQLAAALEGEKQQ